jgi:hypothetical protein
MKDTKIKDKDVAIEILKDSYTDRGAKKYILIDDSSYI